MFKKGQSGNPGGRPKGVGNLRDLAQAHTATALQVLIDVMNDLKAAPSARASAAEAILDRGWGRAPMTLNTNAEEKRELFDQALLGTSLELLKRLPERKRAERDDDTAREAAARSVAPVAPSLLSGSDAEAATPPEDAPPAPPAVEPIIH